MYSCLVSYRMPVCLLDLVEKKIWEYSHRKLWCQCYVNIIYIRSSYGLHGPWYPMSEKTHLTYRQVSNIRRTLVGKEIVDHSDVVGASPVGAAPTTSSFSTQPLTSTDWVKTTTIWDERHLSFEIWCVLYWRLYDNHSYIFGFILMSVLSTFLVLVLYFVLEIKLNFLYNVYKFSFKFIDIF